MTQLTETERLLLCPLKSDDAEFIFRLLNTPGWLEFIGDRGIRTLADAEQYIIGGPAKSYSKNGFGLWLVKTKTGDSIGICGLIKRDTLEDVDLGFAFLPEFEGKGYALEAANASLALAQNQYGIKRVTAITVPGNRRSINLLEKTGMKFEREIILEGETVTLLLFGLNFPEGETQNL